VEVGHVEVRRALIGAFVYCSRDNQRTNLDLGQGEPEQSQRLDRVVEREPAPVASGTTRPQGVTNQFTVHSTVVSATHSTPMQHQYMSHVSVWSAWLALMDLNDA
jgi:hypothetical protein